MPSKSLRKRLATALDDLEAADGPIGRLDAARRLREAADELEMSEVEAARTAGATWSQIAACYGLTKQGAQQRFRVDRTPSEPPARRAKPSRAR